VPAVNPPTFLKWQLGQRLFFDDILGSKVERFSCASCHRPAMGFTEDWAVTLQGKRNTPSLINAVYNRHQFWDGRVAALEEVVVRNLHDEMEPPADATTEQSPRYRHAWSGVVALLRDDPAFRKKYQPEFQRVFGVRQPTQDTIARALATYMRTILSGDSLYDKARQQRGDAAKELRAADFEPFLDDAARKGLQAGDIAKNVLAQKLEAGYALFHGKARCSRCHRDELFTDHDFHNTGADRRVFFPDASNEPGYFAHLPIGLKDARYIGAFKTPTLRALPRTASYMRDGSLRTLQDVVEFYNSKLDNRSNDYLDKELLDDGGRPRRLGLQPDDIQALVLFLRSLDGQPVDAIVTTPRR
jgi:cytochrome c peroxidase